MTAARTVAARFAGAARIHALLLALAALVAAPARAEDATAWLARAATAAKELNYAGTIAFHLGDRLETSRIVHLNEAGSEFEKLTSLDGPAREVIRSNGEVRCYFPDARVVRVEPPSFRNAFPSLSPQQQSTLAQFYDFRKAEKARVAGLEAQAYVFEPKDGFRYGHKFWADTQTGLLLKARLLNERGDAIEQFAFLDVHIGARIDRDMVKPSWPPVPAEWEVKEFGRGEMPKACVWGAASGASEQTGVLRGRLSGLAMSHNPVRGFLQEIGAQAVPAAHRRYGVSRGARAGVRPGASRPDPGGAHRHRPGSADRSPRTASRR